MKPQILLFVLVTMTAGCGDGKPANTATLSGDITVDGKVLPDDAEAYIQFMTTEPGQAPPASVQTTGSHYEAENVPLGNVNVIFNITRLTGRMVKEDNAPGATPYPEREDLVPAKHRNGVPVEITGDNDAFHFEL